MTVEYTEEMKVNDLFGHSINMHHCGAWDEADEALFEGLERKPPHHVAPVDLEPFRRVEWERGETSAMRGDPRWAVHNLIHYVRRPASGDREVFAEYYSTYLTDPKGKTGHMFTNGQREPKDRYQYLPPDYLVGKRVLDLGGNFGGMLHSNLAAEIKWGVGTDYDSKLINVANRIAANEGTDYRLGFYVHDLMSDPLEMIRDFMPEPRADIVFLLAVCAHLVNWNDVIIYAGTLADEMLFEANGADYEQLGQERALWRAYGEVEELAGRGAEGIGARKLFLCRTPHIK